MYGVCCCVSAYSGLVMNVWAASIKAVHAGSSVFHCH